MYQPPTVAARLHVLGTMLAVLWSPPLLAQPPAPTQSQVTVVNVKPDMTRAWRDYLTNDANPAQKKAGVTRRSVWTTATFGEGSEYVLVTPVQSLTDFDDPTPIVKALGQDGFTALGTKRQKLINGSHTFLVTARPELGAAPAAGYQPKLAVQSRSIVTPGHVADFSKFAKDQAAVMMKSGAKGVSIAQAGLGGNPNEFFTLVFFDSFADIAKFADAYGKAATEAKLQPMVNGTVMNNEWRVYRYVPELSIIPQPSGR